MRYSTDLFDLIQSLTQTEKRYVKLFAKAFSSKGTDLQLDLFDAYAQQVKFNEDKIRLDFKERIAAKNFHVSKNRLYQLILKALLQYDSAKNQNYKMCQQIFQAEILRKKGLFQQASMLIDKTIQEAEKEEHYPILLFALTRKLSHAIYSRDIESFQVIIDENFLSNFKEYLTHFEEEVAYVNLEIQTLIITHRKQVIRSDEDLRAIVEIQEHELLQEDYVPFGSEKSKEAYNFINAFLYRYVGNYKKACHYFESFVIELESQGNYSKDMLSAQVGSLNNLMFMQLEGQFYSAALDSCTKLIKIEEHPLALNDRHLLFRIKERVLEFKLQYYLATAQYKEGIDFIKEAQDTIYLVDNESAAFRVIILNYNLAAIYLSNMKFELADDYLQKVLYHTRVREHEYVYSGALVLKLLIHFGLGNMQLLDSLLLNIQRNMSKQKILYKSEKLLIKYLKKFVRIQDSKLLDKSIESLCKELVSLQEVNKTERFFLDQFDLVNWLKMYQQQL